MESTPQGWDHVGGEGVGVGWGKEHHLVQPAVHMVTFPFNDLLPAGRYWVSCWNIKTCWIGYLSWPILISI